jgi:hypothetical protein
MFSFHALPNIEPDRYQPAQFLMPLFREPESAMLLGMAMKEFETIGF